MQYLVVCNRYTKYTIQFCVLIQKCFALLCYSSTFIHCTDLFFWLHCTHLNKPVADCSIFLNYYHKKTHSYCGKYFDQYITNDKITCPYTRLVLTLPLSLQIGDKCPYCSARENIFCAFAYVTG